MTLKKCTRIWDIIPDTHGQASKLEGLLAALGYAERNGAYRHPDSVHRALFLGDFIDRGPDNARVIDIVRRMTGEGVALAIMGNHELNALQFAAIHPDTGQPLRQHSPKNILQHEAFLAEFPLGSPQARDVLSWMMDLPLFLDLGAFRAVHACWHSPSIATLRAICPRDRLTPELLVRTAGDAIDDFKEAVDTVVKGPEAQLPHGFGFQDKSGHFRTMARLAWWNSGAAGWPGITASVPDPETSLPKSQPPDEVLEVAYPPDAPRVFFGHYWLTGTPILQSANTICLDYSAGLDGPLVAYTHAVEDRTLDLGRITCSA